MPVEEESWEGIRNIKNLPNKKIDINDGYSDADVGESFLKYRIKC